VNELGARLHRQRAEIAHAVDPAADPVAALDHQHRGRGARQLARGADAGHPGADDDHVGRRCRLARRGVPSGLRHALRSASHPAMSGKPSAGACPLIRRSRCRTTRR
jgi:hypothetical protein